MWLFALFISCVSLEAFSQSATTLEESLTYFKDGIVFEHQPTHFKTRFRFRLQNRFTYETEEAEALGPELVDFNIRRMRLRLDGNILDPRLLYKIQLSFTRGDFDYDRTEYPNVMRDAAIGWKLTENTTLWYGQTKLPGNRQRVISSGDQQLVDRSILNSTFNIDRDIGAQVYHKMGVEKPLWIKLAVSNGEGRSTQNGDDGLAYTGRIEWLPLGDFTNEGDYFEGDLAREVAPKISLGTVYSLNKKTNRPGGQTGRQFQTVGLNKDIETWFADALFKYQGISWSSEFAKRWSHQPVFLDGANTVTIYNGQGFTTQAGYIYESNIEPVVRYSRLWADRETLSGEDDLAQYTIGINKYINKHRVKIQTDVTYNEEMNRLKNLYSSHWIYRLQLEIGI